MACLEGRNFTIKLYPRDFRRIMRGSVMQSTAIVRLSNLRQQVHADGAIKREVSSPGDQQ